MPPTLIHTTIIFGSQLVGFQISSPPHKVTAPNTEDLDISNTKPTVTATNTGVKETNTLDIWTFQTQQLRLQLLLNKSIAMPDLQLIRDLARKVRVYGAVLHLRWSQIARIPAIVVDDWLAETR